MDPGASETPWHPLGFCSFIPLLQKSSPSDSPHHGAELYRDASQHRACGGVPSIPFLPGAGYR
jgi:hypothetical protein